MSKVAQVDKERVIMSVVKVVAYYTKQNPETNAFIHKSINEQRALLQKFIVNRNTRYQVEGPYGKYQAKSWEIASEHEEIVDKKQRNFPFLDKAIQECRRLGAELIIPDLQDLVKNEFFTSRLLRAQIDFYCLDQPTIQKITLPTLVDTFRRMRERHSQRIRNALKQTAAKLGNPNALKEITKVNKPKRENAVIFALMIEPIIDMYRKQGLSQRKIVDSLNEESFLAPEGGQWVLSQLQKVMERIELNKKALLLMDYIQEFNNKNYSEEQQVKALKAMHIAAPYRKQWDLDILSKVKERLAMIMDIIEFNQFVIDIWPEILEYQEAGLSNIEIAQNLNEQQIDVPERVIWELMQQECKNNNKIIWDANLIDLAVDVAKRREQDIYHLVNPNTFSKAKRIIDEKM